MNRVSMRAKVDLVLSVSRTEGRRAAARKARTLVAEAIGGWLAKSQYPTVRWGSGVTIRGALELRGSGTVVVGDQCFFDDASGRPNRIVVVTPGAVVVLGSRIWMNGATIVASDSVQIGDDSMIGGTLMDTDFHSVGRDHRRSAAAAATRPVVIEENVWVADDTMILKGVTVGRDSVIGAGAVVRRSIPPGKVVIGNPAKVVADLDAAKETT